MGEFSVLASEDPASLRRTPQPVRVPARAPSALRELARLTDSPAGGPVAARPAIAALPLASTQDPAPTHLRLYEALFGRDSLRVARDLIPSHPQVTRATLLALAALQGVGNDVAREEEPGRIPHEHRDPDSPIARELTTERGWDWPYYGAVDATADFVRVLTEYCRAQADGGALLHQAYVDRAGTPRTVADAVAGAVGWLDRRLSANPDGVVEYRATLPGGIENQVWKDSFDAYHHADGTIARHADGIASVEVQAAAYDALLDAADLYAGPLDDRGTALHLRDRADRLRRTVLAEFWTEDRGGYFVLGTDRDDSGAPRQLRVRTSNMGHLLDSRLLDGDDPEVRAKRAAVARQLAGPELLAAGGIRTLAGDEVRYRPGAYHNGSVWPWDTFVIARGLRRHGRHTQAADLEARILRVVATTGMFPEYVRGDADAIRLNTEIVDVWDRDHERRNRVEQPPQEVQAWTVSAVVAIKSAQGRRSP